MLAGPKVRSSEWAAFVHKSRTGDGHTSNNMTRKCAGEGLRSAAQVLVPQKAELEVKSEMGRECTVYMGAMTGVKHSYAWDVRIKSVA